jgi:excisionase family DNA binding protein
MLLKGMFKFRGHSWHLSCNVLSSVQKTPKTQIATIKGLEAQMLTMEKDKQKSKLLTVKEVANYLVVTERTVYRLIKDPDFPAFKVGGQWRFKIELIDGWMSRDRSSNQGEPQFPRHSEGLLAATGRVPH